MSCAMTRDHNIRNQQPTIDFQVPVHTLNGEHTVNKIMIRNIHILVAAIIAWLLSVAAIILVVYWMVHFHDGFSWQDYDPRLFNYHPLFMVIGFIFFAPAGAAVYRLSSQHLTKFWQKTAHFTMQLIALVCVAMGLSAVIKFHNDQGYKNFIDVHSWCGLATIGLFILQFVGGFISFLFPRLPDNLRAKVAKWHAISGKIIVLLAILTAVTGVARERTGVSLTKEQAIANSLAMVLYVLFGVVFFMLSTQSDNDSNRNFQRFE